MDLNLNVFDLDKLYKPNHHVSIEYVVNQESNYPVILNIWKTEEYRSIESEHLFVPTEEKLFGNKNYRRRINGVVSVVTQLGNTL